MILKEFVLLPFFFATRKSSLAAGHAGGGKAKDRSGSETSRWVVID